MINTQLFTLFVKGRSQEGKVCQSARSPSKLKLSDVQLVSGKTHLFEEYFDVYIPEIGFSLDKKEINLLKDWAVLSKCVTSGKLL